MPILGVRLTLPLNPMFCVMFLR
jgi:hypothetical protein